MRKFTSTMLFAAIGCVFALAQTGAQAITFGEVKAKNVQPLSKQEATAVVSGSRMQRGPIQWTNQVDGNLEGSTGGTKAGSPVHGKWRVQDDGAYCVDAQGNTQDVQFKFCQQLYKIGDIYYGFGPQQPDTATHPGMTFKN